MPEDTRTAGTVTVQPRRVRPNLVLGICCMSLLLAGMDVTIVNVALPSIQRDLHASLQGLQWVLDAYTLVVASLLMFSGSMADRFGRRLVFQIGLGLFLTGSLLCSIAHSIAALALYRAVQGVGASMLNPVALSIIVNVFPTPKDRARAIGVWGAVGGVALAVGPMLGGVLTQHVGWRSIFWINLPIGICALVLAALFVPESKAVRPRAVDPAGQLLVFVGLVSLIYAVIEGPRNGWASALIADLFAVSATAWIGFFSFERKRRQPLVDLRFFRSVPFSSAALLAVLAFASFSGFLFLNALYLQQARGFSASAAGMCTLPLALAMIVCAPISGRMVGSRSTWRSLLVSGCATLVSTLILTRLTTATPLALLLVAYALFGVGIGMINPAISNSAVSGMPLSQAGVAAGIASTSRQVGAALGVALAGTIAGATHKRGVNFAEATHPVWWIMAGGAVVVLLLGWASNTPWAKSTTRHVADLLDPADASHAGPKSPIHLALGTVMNIERTLHVVPRRVDRRDLLRARGTTQAIKCDRGTSCNKSG